MELIDTLKIRKIADARSVINELQARLLAREQCLDDLTRAVEIAQYSHQYQLVDSFRQSAEEQLLDRLIMPVGNEDMDIKIRIYE